MSRGRSWSNSRGERGRSLGYRRGEVLGEEGLVELEVVEVLDVLGSLVSPKPLPLQNYSAQLVHSGGLKSLAVRAKMPPQFPFKRRQKPLNLNLERITIRLGFKIILPIHILTYLFWRVREESPGLREEFLGKIFDKERKEVGKELMLLPPPLFLHVDLSTKI
jgi:hypothetical protein